MRGSKQNLRTWFLLSRMIGEVLTTQKMGRCEAGRMAGGGIEFGAPIGFRNGWTFGREYRFVGRAFVLFGSKVGSAAVS